MNEFVLEKLCAVATFQYAKLQTHIAAFKKYVWIWASIRTVLESTTVLDFETVNNLVGFIKRYLPIGLTQKIFIKSC